MAISAKPTSGQRRRLCLKACKCNFRLACDPPVCSSGWLYDLDAFDRVQPGHWMALKSFVPGGLVFNFLSVPGSSSECQPSSRLQKGSGQSDGCRGHFCRKENLLRFVFELVLEKIKILMHLLFKHSLDLNSVCLGLRLGELIAVFLDLTQVPVA